MKGSSKTAAYFALLVTSIVWGTTWIVSKIAIGKMPPLQMASIRQLGAGLIFVLFFLIFKKAPLPTRKQFLWLFIMAVIMFVSANGLSTVSIKYIPAGLSALIGALYPLSVVLIEKILFKTKRITGITFLGLFLGIAGIAIVFYENAFHEATPGFFFGIFLSAIAMLSWSAGSIYIARNKMDIDPYYSVGWQMILAAVILFIISQATGKTIPIADIPGSVWLCIAYLVLFGSIATFIAFIYSMKKLTPAVAALYAYINPLVAMATGHYIIDEKITMNIIWGSVITVTGVFLVNYSMKKAPAATEAEQ